MGRVQIGDYLQDKQPDKTCECKTESMGWAYLSAPSTQGGDGMVDNDKVDSFSKLKSYGGKIR